MTDSYYICNMSVAASIASDTGTELDITRQGVFRFGQYQGLTLYIDTNISVLETNLILITNTGRVKISYERLTNVKSN